MSVLRTVDEDEAEGEVARLYEEDREDLGYAAARGSRPWHRRPSPRSSSWLVRSRAGSASAATSSPVDIALAASLRNYCSRALLALGTEVDVPPELSDELRDALLGR